MINYDVTSLRMNTYHSMRYVYTCTNMQVEAIERNGMKRNVGSNSSGVCTVVIVQSYYLPPSFCKSVQRFKHTVPPFCSVEQSPAVGTHWLCHLCLCLHASLFNVLDTPFHPFRSMEQSSAICTHCTCACVYMHNNYDILSMVIVFLWQAYST